MRYVSGGIKASREVRKHVEFRKLDSPELKTIFHGILMP